jgi:O-antigen/teichoic acid export membrane protein
MVVACFDFSTLLRAINQTKPLVASNLTSAIASGVALFFLLPVAGLVGVAVALVVSSFVEAAYNAWCVRRFYGVTLRKLVPWARAAQVALCAAVVAVPVIVVTSRVRVGMTGVMLASVLYLILFAVLLMATGVEEAITLARRVRNSLAIVAFSGR